MKTNHEIALELAARGFHVFPIQVGSKLPLPTDWQKRATRDTGQITRWFTDPVMGTPLPYNVGISTSRFGEAEALVIVDVDTKKHDGFSTLLELELCGKGLPDTFSVETPSGGKHFYFRHLSAVKQGRNVLGPGIDIRSRGGQCVGPGSILEAGAYALSSGDLRTEIAEAPRWLVEQCGLHDVEAAPEEDLIDAEINQEYAAQRATFYLKHEAPLALEGSAGDATTFAVACKVKDFGVTQSVATELLLSEWNDRCVPPWGPGALGAKVENAYQYGVREVGAEAPEKIFTPVHSESSDSAPSDSAKHPIEMLNREYAFVVAGGGHHILWETEDVDGKSCLLHLSESTFHANLASKTITFGKKPQPLSRVWMGDARRRSYRGICFKPGKEVGKDWYNLWKGFAVEPTEKEGSCASLEAFLEHAKENVCQGDESLFRWLIGYFAHLVQRPYEKPLVALVFRGSKGVGKNALVERISYLLGNHALVADDRRYLTSNFNGHLENNLMLVLDEAFWSGDKEAEGRLKGLITGTHHNIEHKGKEPYKVDNCTRVVIVGNEGWLVPASEDERRYCVFDVGDGRKRDNAFFEKMRRGMEGGGYAHLLRYLLNYDISELDFTAAPNTKGLLAQKIQSLGLVHSWWLETLLDETDLRPWDSDTVKSAFRGHFVQYCRGKNVKSRLPDAAEISQELKKVLPSLGLNHRKRFGSEVHRVYRVPSLAEARLEFEKFIGQPISWPEDDSSVLDDSTASFPVN